MLKRRMGAVSFGLLMLTLISLGCHSVPLGDPEKSVADPSLAGWWLDEKAEKSKMLIYLTPYDARTYFSITYAFTGDGDSIKRDMKFTTKAWLTTVGGMDVMTFKIIDPEWDLEGGADAAKRYAYYRIRKMGPGTIEATRLNTDLLKDTKTPEELAKKIADNVNNPELWMGSDPSLLKLVPDDRKNDIKKILKLFEPAKAE